MIYSAPPLPVPVMWGNDNFPGEMRIKPECNILLYVSAIYWTSMKHHSINSPGSKVRFDVGPTSLGFLQFFILFLISFQ